jgi:hypothetical protein
MRDQISNKPANLKMQCTNHRRLFVGERKHAQFRIRALPPDTLHRTPARGAREIMIGDSTRT